MENTTSQAILLVDGYNIIGSSCSLQQIKEHKGLEHARNFFIESMINYTGYKDLETTIVFDAHYQKTPSNVEKFTKNLSVHYTSYSETADTYIEKFCAGFVRQNPHTRIRIIVATSDQAHRNTVVGYGAEWMSAQILIKDLESTTAKHKRNLRHRSKSQGRFLFNSLDTKTQQVLVKMRFGGN